MPAPQPDYGTPRDWHDVASLRTPPVDTVGDQPAVWEAADHIPDALLGDLLDVARDSVIAFAPVLPEDYPLGKCPASYRLAHLMQTRNLWNAVEVDSSGGFGDGEYTIRPMPLDWIIKQILRPKTGVPVAL
ncbi:hypothetical protein JOF28_001963 [Leucobacter exalbidus]|uniref:Uncharacterized protein n=1 Tax=Leucobacter exalbidus TaxID=662960 RepID=A0A940T681_9MICO|nr:hypothetical protein [Leucobacter exalbidus]MBP1326731.1 hypothetical protein [Leucobacter exalbidus]